ncbi:MAG: hypothetical protein JST55_10345 [Bacteroidetes bacterium]|nr:hypothetical protein [Bacteroidota bacterium]
MLLKSKTFYAICLSLFSFFVLTLSSCNNTVENIINTVTTVEVKATDRLDSANAQATRKYGASTKLVLIMGRNVNANGKTSLSVLNSLANPDTISAWLYVYRVPSDTSLRIYTPNPLITANDCIELTAFFNPNQLINLIQDTTARNIVSGALSVVTSANVGITTPSSVLINSDVSLNLANSTNPIIKFNSSFVPDTSHMNGSVFLSSGTNQSRNMFLIPAAGTLNLPAYITNLTGFPADLWIVQYKKTTTVQQSLILGTIVQTGQLMGVPIGIQSAVINLSKDASE